MEKPTQADVLKWMLGQLYRAENHKKQLDERLERICEAKNSPIGGTNYSPLPRSAADNDGAAALIFKESDVEDRIYEQKRKIDSAMERVMDIIDFIPITELEREIFEMRHIDLLDWAEIEHAIPMSRSQCIRRYNRGIENLLQKETVQNLVRENEADYIAWCVKARLKNQSGGMRSKNKTGNKRRRNKAGK